MIIDPRIVDLLEGFGADAWQGHVWRHVFHGRDPLAPSHAGGRWAPRSQFGVLYTSVLREGAIAEAAHLIAQYTIPPSVTRVVCKIDVTLARVIDLTSDDRLAQLGVDRITYPQSWGPCPDIGAASNFLGFQGILAPNARFDCDNLIVLTDRIDTGTALEVVREERLLPD